MTPSWAPQVPTSLNECDLPAFHVAVRAAENAATVLRHHYQRGTEVREKGPKDLVTDADVEAERVIIRAVRESFPQHAILAEESGVSGCGEDQHLWIIDPLDGTTNFAHRVPHFATSIAYCENGTPQVGVILNPITNDWYIAVAGQGAWYNGQRASVASTPRVAESLIACGFYYDRGAMMRSTLETIADFFLGGVHGVRRFGTASLDLAFVGRGLFEIFFEFRLSPWDFAAGKLFVEEAGGTVTTCQGRPIPLDGKSSILATNGSLHEEALAIVSQRWDT